MIDQFLALGILQPGHVLKNASAMGERSDVSVFQVRGGLAVEADLRDPHDQNDGE